MAIDFPSFPAVDQTYLYGSTSITLLDSPASASAVTYKTKFMNPQNASGVLVQENAARSTITLMEIAG